MYTVDELIQLMKDREDQYSIIDLLDPTVDDLVEALEGYVRKNAILLSEYYEEDL